ncbi:energy coupling factor transporter S component ThiW [Terrilactibacillus sp. BCM23-1]|uniref:Energy coupling factor transporter S component ThiW n=1 Tax=Terrilactibacillus tamarindi TaxID=2599694 RepID=A0A6N8CQ04_9BACI|nr:energy coupling factor transporter S component ThiW [Terrilactibacillus tamarindi]MTT32111.1 energy coupling factor transporter S component ThiW [Terrilactibacillus tamarindi]
MSTIQKLCYSAILIAFGVVTSQLIYVPVGFAKAFPVQHIVNVLSAIILGPGYAVLNAFCISLIRNIFGGGTLFAFPGSMIGAFFAGMIYLKTKKYWLSAVGEVFGTGILGALASFPIAKFIYGQQVVATFYIVPFLVSTSIGSLIAYVMIKLLSTNPSFTRIIGGKKK